jgi:hypothetical protein
MDIYPKKQISGKQRKNYISLNIIRIKFQYACKKRHYYTSLVT